jgi:Tfp pilus assembly protein PilX
MSRIDVDSRERGPSIEALLVVLVLLTIAAMVLAHVTHAG